jgi:undecaprenyl-diphosphatase
MEILKTLFLGIIQGLTEFLPVSSSGHLIIAETFMGGGPESEASSSSMLLEVILHAATGIAVLFVFRKDIINIVRGWFSKDTVERKNSLSYSGWVILATVPAALVGILLNDQIDALFDTSKGSAAAYIASSMLFVTAALLIFSSRCKNVINANGINADGISPKGINIGGGMTTVRALLIGITQAIAIMPGISRSGSTIAVALIIGVAREEAGRFSFMLALPAIFGAALLQARHVESWGSLASIDVIVGFAASLVVGVIALKFLLTFIKKGQLHYFGYYCAAAAVVSLTALTFFRR